ncbi:hypothetical protein WUBG_10588, partial [Wuchereria bancrofti]
QCNNTSSIHSKEGHCSELNVIANNPKLLSRKWVPVESNHQCVVVCRSLKTGEEKKLGKMVDGSACLIEGYNKSVCVNGICQVAVYRIDSKKLEIELLLSANHSFCLSTLVATALCSRMLATTFAEYVAARVKVAGVQFFSGKTRDTSHLATPLADQM